MGKFIDWLCSPFKKKNPDDPYDVFKPKERNIYSYWDGRKMIESDPLVVYKRMMAVAPDLNVRIKIAQSPSKDAGKAHEEMLGNLRTIFQVKPFEEGGLTELQTVMLFDHFLTFIGRVKKNSSPTATPAPGTLADSPPPSSEEKSPPTSNSSGSGSTAPEPPPEPPTSSHSA